MACITARATLSCIPGIGFFVDVYNTVTTQLELGRIIFNQVVRTEGINRANAEGNVSEAARLIAQVPEENKHLEQVLKTKVLFKKCAIVGHLLSLIGLVVLAVLGIFAGPGAWVCISLVGLNALYDILSLIRGNKDLKDLRTHRVD